MNTAFILLAEAEGGNVIDRIQALGTADKQLADPDYWGSVGIIALTGILVVFLILAILIFFFWLMGTIFKSIDKAKAEKKAAAAEAAKAAAESAKPAAVVEEEPAAAEELDNDEELIAVISAAIAAYSDGESYAIKSIRKHTDRRTRSAWSLAGLSRNMRNS